MGRSVVRVDLRMANPRIWDSLLTVTASLDGAEVGQAREINLSTAFTLTYNADLRRFEIGINGAVVSSGITLADDAAHGARGATLDGTASGTPLHPLATPTDYFEDPPATGVPGFQSGGDKAKSDTYYRRQVITVEDTAVDPIEPGSHVTLIGSEGVTLTSTSPLQEGKWELIIVENASGGNRNITPPAEVFINGLGTPYSLSSASAVALVPLSSSNWGVLSISVS